MGVLGKSSEASSSARGRRAGWCLCLSVVALFSGVVLVLIGVWGAHLSQRFEYVYQDIECRLKPPTVTDVTFDGPAWLLQGMKIHLKTTTECKNPNPYSVQVSSTKSSEIFMGRRMLPVGNLTRIPESELEAHGTGHINASLVIAPTGELLDDLIGHIGDIIGGLITGRRSAMQIPIFMEQNLMVKVDVKLLFGPVTVTKWVNKDCGMNLMMTASTKAQVGPMSCADEFSELELKDVDSTSGSGDTLHFSADGLGGDDVEEAERLKTIATGVMMGVGFGLGIVLLASGGLCLARFLHTRRRAAAEEAAAAAQESKGGAPPSAVPSQEAATLTSEAV